ncbi:hypothetical protein O181_071481 [Austropuccinia psidii MF-1]|uniref:Uncharacterized protein n=1 Tax=Austropuccinia psidii MF-1 TaxID=1389203 RepID=A0A9Q3F0T6_9BASI|nr:hypothetical protein [Austropuccinia psidii MF-1]
METFEGLEMKSAPHNQPASQKKKYKDTSNWTAMSTSKMKSHKNSSENSKQAPTQIYTNLNKARMIKPLQNHHQMLMREEPEDFRFTKDQLHDPSKLLFVMIKRGFIPPAADHSLLNEFYQ